MRPDGSRAAALRYMWSENNPGVTTKDLATEFDVTTSAISQVLCRLEADGLARREPGQTEIRFRRDLGRREAIPGVLGNNITRTPDTWYATDAGLKVASELVEAADA